MGKIRFYFDQLQRRMWFLPAIFSAGAIATVLVAYFAAGYAPDELPFTMPSNGVVSILTILASSLLSVAVFSLSTMTSALATASSATTPRAVALIVSDRRAQTSISIFIGAFLFAIVGIIGLSAEVYSEAGRLILFFVTLAVVILVVGALIRWIGQISAIGRVGETIDRVERATATAFESADLPRRFGCHAGGTFRTSTTVSPDTIGYVQHFDADALQKLAENRTVRIHVAARPGTYVDRRRHLAEIEGNLDDGGIAAVRRAFVIGHSRTFDRDPRFGLIVLNEIASKALSAGINDPGTAIDVIGTLVRVLDDWQCGCIENDASDLRYDRLSVDALRPHDIVEDAFRPIARDGAGQIEVVLRLLAGLDTLQAAHSELSEAAHDMALSVIARAEAALTADDDLAALASGAQAFR